MSHPHRWRFIAGSGQKIATGAASVDSAAVGGSTYAVLLSCTADCHIEIGVAPVATANSPMLKALHPGLVIGISPGEKVAVLEDAAAGSLSMVEMTA